MKRYRLLPSVSGFWGGFAARMMFQRDAARKENARLRKALEYYADDIHYDPYFFGDATCDVTEDGGHIAREALSNGEKSNAL